jgi:DNA helicase-2/ATP-dependent DNA helicase PcrA
VKLTDQQQQIVGHLEGPALVFAVAGAGKTTCMVYRIRHIVQKKICPPHKILATTFNNSAVLDMSEQLEQIGVPVGKNGADCRTLHSLGYRIIRSAITRKLISDNWQISRSNSEIHADRLIRQTLLQMAIQDGVDVSALDIDREDLKNQIAIWKGSLAFATLSNEDLPKAAYRVASQAAHRNPQYLRAYKIYESLRKNHHLITFDDMLMMGWQLLVQYPVLLEAVQKAYQFVIVDEFQDVNFAQYQILDLLTEPHRNYMVIGDDDQCIYEWRGANPNYILNFEQQYRATVYTISDNFRSTAHQLIPANAVISFNRKRYPKSLSLTQGFKGITYLVSQEDHWKVARHIASEIARCIQNGQSPADIAILLRLYSQTPYLETAFMEQQIPYKIIGAEEFYKRTELIPLFQYLSFAIFEAHYQKIGYPTERKQIEKYLDLFAAIANQPRRYISREIIEGAQMMSQKLRCSVLEVLVNQKEVMPRRVHEKVIQFLDTIRLLTMRLKRPAHRTLAWLVDNIEYNAHLLRISGQNEIGQTRIQTVHALIEFARLKKHSCYEFIDYLREISLAPTANPTNNDPVKMMTIYRAKGLEWPTVFIPGGSAGLAPFLAGTSNEPDEIKLAQVEAERRLFYVALTRAKNTLYIYFTQEDGISPFLQEARIAELTKSLKEFQQLLESDKLLINPDNQLRLINFLGKFELERYFTLWTDQLKTVAERFCDDWRSWEEHYRQAYDAEQRYRQALAKYEAENESVGRKIRTIQQIIRDTAIVIRPVNNSYVQVRAGQRISFEQADNGEVIALCDGLIIGALDVKAMHGYEPLAVNWAKCVAIVNEIKGQQKVLAKFSKLQFQHRYLQSQVGGWRKPLPPSAATQKLLTPYFQKGLKLLLSFL